MSGGHTPGPWLQSNGPTGFPILCTGAEGDLITLEGNDANDADSRLCAAAPDILAALRLIATQALSDDWTAQEAYTFMRGTARAAIAKAQGKV